MTDRMMVTRKHPLGLIELCPECGSGDIDWCAISRRVHCNDCGYGQSPSFGETTEETVARWNARVQSIARAEPEPKKQTFRVRLDHVRTETYVFDIEAEDEVDARDQAQKLATRLDIGAEGYWEAGLPYRIEHTDVSWGYVDVNVDLLKEENDPSQP